MNNICKTCGHEEQYHGMTVCMACIEVSEGLAPPGEKDAGPHAFTPVAEPEADAVATTPEEA